LVKSPLINIYKWLCYAVFNESNTIVSTCVELMPLLAKMQNIVRGKHIFSPFMFPLTRLFVHEKHIYPKTSFFIRSMYTFRY